MIVLFSISQKYFKIKSLYFKLEQLSPLLTLYKRKSNLYKHFFFFLHAHKAGYILTNKQTLDILNCKYKSLNAS